MDGDAAAKNYLDRQDDSNDAIVTHDPLNIIKSRVSMNLKSKLGLNNQSNSRNGAPAPPQNLIAEAIKTKIRQAQE